MEIKTPAIVLGSNHTPSDSGFMVNLYTRSQGLMTVYLKGTKRSALRRSMMMPLSVLDIVVFQKSGYSVFFVRDSQVRLSSAGISSDPIKTTMVLFLSEVIQRCIRYSEPDLELFNFLEDSIKTFNELKQGVANFHLVLLIRLTHYLGFFPNVKKFSSQSYFDLQQGTFVPNQPTHENFLAPKEAMSLAYLLRLNYSTMYKLELQGKERAQILRHIIDYYRLHVDGFGLLKSLEVLEVVFS